jgi:hypothetical protein
MPEKKELIQNACEDLLDDFKNILSWKWDDNFEALLAEFKAEGQDKIHSILEKHLTLQWDNKSIKKAPKDIKSKVGDYGDLRSGQLLFTLDAKKNIFIVAAWWPWGDGKTVSMRIASPEAKDPGVLDQIKSFFSKS